MKLGELYVHIYCYALNNITNEPVARERYCSYGDAVVTETGKY